MRSIICLRLTATAVVAACLFTGLPAVSRADGTNKFSITRHVSTVWFYSDPTDPAVLTRQAAMFLDNAESSPLAVRLQCADALLAGTCSGADLTPFFSCVTTETTEIDRARPWQQIRKVWCADNSLGKCLRFDGYLSQSAIYGGMPVLNSFVATTTCP